MKSFIVSKPKGKGARAFVQSS
uniref:Uncharacterized protein n=1 Tax=Arundo donax TaxID=35708 RepID=A0A0A8YR99_ARUDO